MTQREHYFNLIRRLAAGDYDGYQQQCAALDQEGWDGLALVVGATFYVVVQERVGPSPDKASVIRFVSAARADISDREIDIDPAAAELLVQAAATGDTASIVGFDPNAVVETQMLLVREGLRSLDPNEVQAIFNEAEILADEWSQGEQG